jgi:uncharacterized damage-inducible protein DinB
MQEQLLETWTIHNRVNLYLLDAIEPEALQGTASSKGRSVGEVFLHLHNVRLLWFKSAAPELLEGLQELEKEQASEKPLLHAALAQSGEAVEQLLKKGFEQGGKIKGFKPHAIGFLGYLISHESYHRGEIGLILTQAGHPLDQKVAYGMWAWGVR